MYCQLNKKIWHNNSCNHKMVKDGLTIGATMTLEGENP
jgi:hypothetical protein